MYNCIKNNFVTFFQRTHINIGNVDGEGLENCLHIQSRMGKCAMVCASEVTDKSLPAPQGHLHTDGQLEASSNFQVMRKLANNKTKQPTVENS